MKSLILQVRMILLINAKTDLYLRELYVKRRFTTIVKVLYLKAFDRKINYDCLESEGLLSTQGPRLNSKLTYEQYLELVKLGEEAE